MNSIPYPSKNPEKNWNNDSIQFPRLIAELEACGAFTPKVVKGLSASMDLDSEDIYTLVTRAQDIWDGIKERT
jgi:hypothetical protein